MGKDDLFHKRKAKKQQDLARRRSKREPYEKVLIVCEGSKTEPNYFKELKDHYTLNTANVRISGECGSDPLSVVGHGKQLYDKEQEKGDAYDRVYCVFDRDSHETYHQALDKVKSLTPKSVFFPIPSVPCFEYWFLLHFTYTTTPFASLDGRSVCSAVIAELKKYWPEYEKATRGTFCRLLEQLGYAKANAKRASEQAIRNDTDNPSTRVHELVEYLQRIKGNPTSGTTTRLP